MSEGTTPLIYYKRNVNYVVGGRYNIVDRKGWALTNENPYIAITRDNLRDFKLANKYAILNGLIVETAEPNLDWETPNTITDEQAEALVKNLFGLKKLLPTITAEQPLYKLLDEAKTQGRSQKIINLIEDRIEELVGDKPSNMQGVT